MMTRGPRPLEREGSLRWIRQPSEAVWHLTFSAHIAVCGERFSQNQGYVVRTLDMGPPVAPEMAHSECLENVRMRLGL